MIKKFFGGLAIMTALSAPVALTSCSEDDVNTVLELLDLILGADDLANSAWITADSSMALEFGNSKDGVYYDVENTNGVAFSYTLDTSTNVLTLQFSNGSVQYTITAFTKNSSLTLRTSSGQTITLKYYTGE